MKTPHPHLQTVPAAAAAPGDDALFALVQAGDRRAFQALVQRHQASVRRFVGLVLADDETARDVAQEVFLFAWDRRASYVPSGRLRVWLLAIARNLAQRERRRRGLRRFFGLAARRDGPSMPSLEVDPGERELGAQAVAGALPDDALTELVRRERDLALRAALGRLPAKMREAVALRFMDDLSYEEMADALGDNVSTLRSRVHFGLAKLATLVSAEVMR